MMRPSEQAVSDALAVLDAATGGEQRRALRVIREALKPREVWPAKEAAACLGVTVSNLRTARGLPAPCQVFDRPSVRFPDKKEKWYWRDEIEALAKVKRAGKEGGR